MEYGAAAALEADGGAATAGDFGEDRLHLTGNYFGDGGEAQAVFVAEGQVAEEIADGDDTASFQSGGAVRAYAVEVFDRVGQGDGGHRILATLLYHRSRVGGVTLGKSKDLTQRTQRKAEDKEKGRRENLPQRRRGRRKNRRKGNPRPRFAGRATT